MFDAILFSVILAVTPADKSEVPTDRLAEFIDAKSPQTWAATKRTAHARVLAERIRVEAKRRGLDPVALTSIAWLESNFQPWVRGKGNGRREGEIGVWQLFRQDVSAEAARRRLEGCSPPARLTPTLRAFWVQRAAQAQEKCEAQEVAEFRMWHGYWLARELQDPVVSTYVAALEIRQHVDQAAAQKWWAPTPPPECKGLPVGLVLYARFNSGPRPPKIWYIVKLCRRYRIVAEQTR